MLNSSLELFVNKSVVVLNKNTSVRVAARVLFERRLSTIMVCDDQGQFVGLVTDRDLTCLVLAFQMPDTTPLADVMASEILFVDKSAQLSDIISIMERNGVRRVPVIEKSHHGHQKCIGMIGLDDLILSEAISLRNIARVVRAQTAKRMPAAKISAIHENAHQHVTNQFFKILSETMNLPRSLTERIATRLISRLVQRLPRAEAERFILQLPTDLHKEFFKISMGPDSSIDDHVILSDLTQEFQILESEAIHVAHQFWNGLKKFADQYVLNEVMANVPYSVADLFSGREYSDSVVEHADLNFD